MDNLTTQEAMDRLMQCAKTAAEAYNLVCDIMSGLDDKDKHAGLVVMAMTYDTITGIFKEVEDKDPEILIGARYLARQLRDIKEVSDAK